MPIRSAELRASAIEGSVSSNVVPEVHHHDTISRVSQLLEGPIGQVKVVDVAVAPQLLCCHTLLDLYARQDEHVSDACGVVGCKAAMQSYKMGRLKTSKNGAC